LNALGVSALLILALGSQTLFDAGFQLSFAAVLSLIIFYPPLGAAIGSLGGNSSFIRLVRGALRVMAVTAVATLGTLPLTAGVFWRISLIGIITNILVIPATGISVLLGGVMLLLAPAWSALAELYAAANWGVLRLTLSFTHLCAAPSWASLDTPWFRPIHTLLFAATLYTLCSWTNPARFRKSLILTLALAILSLGGHPPPPGLRLTMLDVGQGDALLFGTPGGRHLLVDCGPASPLSDAGRETILPLLAREGIDTLDWLVVTHGHSDHAGGLRSLLSSGRVRAAGAPANLASKLSALIGHKVTPLGAGDIIDVDPAIRCYVLWPAPCVFAETDGNDGSLVLRLQYGSTRFLLPGDAGFDVENVLVRQYGTFLRAECLKVAHHASLTSTGEEFLSAVEPRLALVSVGRNNRFRHPAGATLSRIRAKGAIVRRTDLTGASIVESDGSAVSLVR
jgi:competence protein ComEC